MSKIIAVCGSPSSGKTTTALKIAEELYNSKKGVVLFLSPDTTVPTLSYIFPNSKDTELFSIGKALDKTDIYKEDILKQIVSVKTMRNFGFLGYKACENKYSYPKPTEDKVKALFRALREIADYTVIDCSDPLDNLISYMAITESDSIIKLVTPDLKCISYYSSQSDILSYMTDKTTTVLCINDKYLYLPIDEVKAHFKNVEYTISYSTSLKRQAITGRLSERIEDRKYRKEINEIIKKVV